MLGGSEVYDGVERLYGADWQSLGQKSNVDLAAAARVIQRTLVFLF